jgi:hypothetical protein
MSYKREVDNPSHVPGGEIVMKLLVIILQPDTPLGYIADFPRAPRQRAIDSWEKPDALYEIIVLREGLSAAQRYYLDVSPHVSSYTIVEIEKPYSPEKVSAVLAQGSNNP